MKKSKALKKKLKKYKTLFGINKTTIKFQFDTLMLQSKEINRLKKLLEYEQENNERGAIEWGRSFEAAAQYETNENGDTDNS
jgi:hypothetical protein